MARFTDKENRDWNISVNVQTVDEMQSIGFDVRKLLTDKDELQKLYDDPFLIVDIIAIVTKEQRGERDLTVNDLFKSLEGPQLDEATKAFIEALVNFFQNRQRALLIAMLAKMDEAYAEAMTKLAEKIEKADLTEVIDTEIAKATKDFPTTST